MQRRRLKLGCKRPAQAQLWILSRQQRVGGTSAICLAHLRYCLARHEPMSVIPPGGRVHMQVQSSRSVSAVLSILT